MAALWRTDCAHGHPGQNFRTRGPQARSSKPRSSPGCARANCVAVTLNHGVEGSCDLLPIALRLAAERLQRAADEVGDGAIGDKSQRGTLVSVD